MAMLRAIVPRIAHTPEPLGEEQSEDGEEQPRNFMPKSAYGVGKRLPEAAGETARSARNPARDDFTLLDDHPALRLHLRCLRACGDYGILRLAPQRLRRQTSTPSQFPA